MLSMTERARRTLKGISLFDGLSNQDRREYEQRCLWRQYHANEQIIDRHSDSRNIFFVVKGKVRVVNYSVTGREITLGDIGAGDFFGELAAIDGEPRSATVVALEDSLLASMPPDLLVQLVTEHPDISLTIMRRLADLVRTSIDRIMDLSTLGAYHRVHAELLRMARRNLRDDNTAAIQPIPVHAEIAGRVSTSRETVARVMSELNRKGLIQRNSDSLVVLDIDRLQEMVEHFRGD